MTIGQAKADNSEPLGLYVHVPFCASTCDFCAFYQVKPTAPAVKSFFDGLKSEAALIHWPRKVSTMFWGGGTPGLLPAGDLSRLGLQMIDLCGGVPPEWTVELAPASVTVDRLKALKDLGVSRVSMGVQSFQPALLDGLGRLHTLEQVMRAYERVRAENFSSVNLDLMFALPGQTAAEWEADVAQAVALAPDHLSTYCLTFEEDTALWIKLSQGRVKLDPEHEARLYEQTWDQLAAAGYGQYEVSNFARPGHACQHNVNTWRMHEWIGLGPSAASQHGGWRGGNMADLAGWQTHLARGERMTEDRVEASLELRAEDAFIFGLRMNEGVDLAAWKKTSPGVPWASVETLLGRMVSDELAHRDRSLFRLTRRGRLLADAVGAELMEAFNTPVCT